MTRIVLGLSAVGLLWIGLGLPAGFAQEGEQPAEQPAEKAEQPAENPLKKWIKGQFNPRKNQPRQPLLPPPNQPAMPAPEQPGNEPQPAKRRGLDHIDERAPYDPTVSDALDKSRTLLQRKQWNAALAHLELVLERPLGMTAQLPNGQIVNAHFEAHRQLALLPAETLDAWRQRNEPSARESLDAALDDHDVDRLTEVATRFFLTPSGNAAANCLVELHLDRAQFGLAARWCGFLDELKAPGSEHPVWRLRMALILNQIGRKDASQAIVKELAAAHPGQKISIGNRTLTAEEWLAQTKTLQNVQVARLDDWTMLFGSPRRTGTVSGGTPLLVPRWFRESVQQRSIVEQIEFLTEDLINQNGNPRALIPASNLLAVDGKVVYRTFRGIRVVDINDGAILWETQDAFDAETVLTGSVPRRLVELGLWGNVQNNLFSTYTSGFDRHPLVSFLFCDGTRGLISSDGKQVFVLEDHAVLSNRQPGDTWSNAPNLDDPFRRDWTTNQLVAYDLETGRANWRIGGRASDGGIDLPLAGHYFHGPPVADRDELYAVAETADEVRLLCLSAKTGEKLWSAMLSHVDPTIDRDYGRRWLPAQIALTDELAICPTTMGWLVAVDRVNHGLVWIHRYSQPGERREYDNGNGVGGHIQQTQLNGRWCPSAPVVMDNRVIYTPSEEALLDCVDLNDGARLWSVPKGDYLYLGGVTGEFACLVGRRSMDLLSLQEGKVLRSVEYESQALPGGQGVLTSDRFLLPLQDGQLLSINLKKDEPPQVYPLPDRSLRLGNLMFHRGALLSLDAFGVTCYEQSEALLEEIQRRKRQNPADPWALLREAEIQLFTRRQPLDSLELLRKIDASAMSETLRKDHRELLRDALDQVIRAGLEEARETGVFTREAELRQLAGLATSPEEKMLQRQLQIQRSIAERKQWEALLELQELGESADLGVLVPRSGQSGQIRLDIWVRSQLEQLWPQLEEAARTAADQRVGELARQAAEQSDELRRRFLAVWDFHPAAQAVRWRQIDSWQAKNRWGEAELAMLRLARSADATVAARSWLALRRMYGELGLTEDAEYVQGILQSRYADSPAPGGLTVAELLQRQPPAALIAPVPQSQVNWEEHPTQLVRSGGGYSYSATRDNGQSVDSPLPWFERHRLDYNPNTERLKIVRSGDDQSVWQLSLQRQSISHQGNNLVILACGHRLYLMHKDVLHCLSCLDRETLWTYRLETSHSRNGYYSPEGKNAWTTMQPDTGLPGSESVLTRSQQTGMLAAANENYVCLYGQKGFLVLNADTGEVAWTCDELPAGHRLFGVSSYLLELNASNQVTRIYRAVDGQELAATEHPELTPERLTSLLATTIYCEGDTLVTMQPENRRSLLGLARPRMTLTDVDLRDGTSRWKRQFSPGTLFSLPGRGQLAALGKLGSMQTLDLTTGWLRDLGTIPTQSVQKSNQQFVLVGADRLYLILNESHSTNAGWSSESLPSLKVNGQVVAFDTQAGRKLWEQRVEDQHLLLYRLADMPCLVFSSRKGQSLNQNLYYFQVRLLLLGKETGKILLQEQIISSDHYYLMDYDRATPYIEVRSYQDRLRFQPNLEENDSANAATTQPGSN